jgi:hypothetical protein
LGGTTMATDLRAGFGAISHFLCDAEARLLVADRTRS